MKRGALVALVLLGSLIGCAVERTVSGRRDFTVDPTIQYTLVTFPDLLAHPTAYRAMNVEFEAMFYRHDESIWCSFYTQFNTTDYASFSAWKMESRVWELEGHLSSVATLYMRRSNGDLSDLVSCPPYSRVRLRGRVASDYENRPWIEVHELDVEQRDIFTSESLKLLVAGMTDASENRPAPSKEKLERALLMPLSNEARYVAHMTLGRLYEEGNDFVRAMSHFDGAGDVKSGDSAAVEGYQRNEKLEERRQEIEEKRESGK
jgi:hypothetical protein